MHDFRRLRVWDEAMHLAVLIYRATRAFPKEERFGLVSQLRAAAVSVSSNIAEGAGRGGSTEMAYFLRIALGSLSEVDSQFELARRLEIGDPDPEIHSLIVGLRAKILRLHDKLAGIRR